MNRSAPGSGGFVVHGPVERGDERGRTLGFPTANLAIEGIVIPDGVWAGWFARDVPSDTLLPTAISVGSRPTFYGRAGVRLIEAHILDFSDDLYDELVTVALAHRLRPQRHFPSVDALVTQLEVDVAETRAWCVRTLPQRTDLHAVGVGRGVALSQGR